MSVVANVVCPTASWVAYDGRRSKDNVIISESVDKSVMVNSSVCVGYTGCLELAELVVLNLKQHLVGISSMTSDVVADAIFYLLPKLNAPEDIYADFLITGINSRGQMASYTLGSRHELRENIPDMDGLLCSVLCSPLNTIQLPPYVDRHIQKSGFNSNSIKNALREYVFSVSKADPSVNSNCRILEIRR